MSYTDVTLAEGSQMNPVGTQEPSAGAGIPTPNSLLAKASEQMHESALRDDEFKVAVTEAVTNMFELKSNWKPKTEKVKFVINCPSGQTVLAKHLNTMDLLEADLIEDLDFFTKRLFPASDSDKEEDSSLWTVLSDIVKRRRFVDLLNRLLEISIVTPRVINDGVEIATRADGTKFLISGSEMSAEDNIKVFGRSLPPLSENETYASAVDFTDKMAIFGELNKPLSVIQPFRQESLVGLASMESSESFRS